MELLEQILDQLTDIIDTIYKHIQVLDSSILLYGGLGLVLLILVILVLLRRRRTHSSAKDGEIEFLEVGPEPVIVYRKPTENPEPLPEPPTPQSQPIPKSDSANRPQEEHAVPPPTEAQHTPTPNPELEIKTEPEPISLPEPVSIPEPDPIPEPKAMPAPIHDPEPEQEPEPEPIPVPKPKIKQQSLPQSAPFPKAALPESAPMEPLPFLLSDLATDSVLFFSQQGYHIEQIVYQGSFGADYIAVRPGLRIYIQVKDRKKKITENAAQEVYSYAKAHDCGQAILITASGFSGSTARAALKMNVLLWDLRTYKKIKKNPHTLGGNAAATKD